MSNFEKNECGNSCDKQTNAKLKVTFFWPFSGDYWIIELDPDYQWVVVSEPKREYLWILSRTPQMPAAIYQDLLGKLHDRGFDLKQIEPSRP